MMSQELSLNWVSSMDLRVKLKGHGTKRTVLTLYGHRESEQPQSDSVRTCQTTEIYIQAGHTAWFCFLWLCRSLFQVSHYKLLNTDLDLLLSGLGLQFLTTRILYFFIQPSLYFFLCPRLLSVNKYLTYI